VFGEISEKKRRGHMDDVLSDPIAVYAFLFGMTFGVAFFS